MPPYRKKGHAKYKGRRKATTRGTVYGAAGYQLYKDVMKLKNLINVEFKLLDTSGTNAVSTTGAVWYLNLVPQGDTGITRDGSQFRNKSVDIRFDVTQAAVLGQSSWTRVVLGIHKNVNSTQLTPADIWQNLNPRSPRNYDNQKDVIILKEWNVLNVDGQANTIAYKKYHTEVDLITRYQSTATSGVIAGVEHGGIFLAAIGDKATNGPTLQFTSRVRFVDN